MLICPEVTLSMLNHLTCGLLEHLISTENHSAFSLGWLSFKSILEAHSTILQLLALEFGNIPRAKRNSV